MTPARCGAMQAVVTATGMAAVDKRAIDELGVPSLELMENAGRAVFERLRFRIGTEEPVAILCGAGNNGGDGFVIARCLREWGHKDVRAFLLGDPRRISADCKTNAGRWAKTGADLRQISEVSLWENLRDQVMGAPHLVDAVLGTGFEPPLRGFLEGVLGDLAAHYTGNVYAVDIPSGLNGASGDPSGTFLHAQVTLALGAAKLAHVLDPARSVCGTVEVLDIGLPAAAFSACEPVCLSGEPQPPALRAPASHKGDFGRVLIVGGSPGMEGAARLAGLGALRAGAGWTQLAVPQVSIARLGGCEAGIMVQGVAGDFGHGFGAALKAVEMMVQEADVVVLGPGIGLEAGSLVQRAWAGWHKPLVVDADALRLLGEACGGNLAALRKSRAGSTPVILTPHPGEMDALLKRDRKDWWPGRVDSTRTAAEDLGHALVLKTSTSICAAPGHTPWINGTGSATLAQGGSGDLLSGMIGALWAARLRASDEAAPAAWNALCAAVYAHGLAGERCARAGGQGPDAVADNIAPTLSSWRRRGTRPGPAPSRKSEATASERATPAGHLPTGVALE